MRKIIFLTAIAFVAGSPDAGLAASDSQCSAFGSSGPLPPQCMTPGSSGGSVKQTDAVSIDDIEKASYSRPNPKALPKGVTFVAYDFEIANLCGNNSMVSIADDYVGPKKTPVFFEVDKAVAMAAVATFPDAQKDEPKQIKIPLIAKSNFGDTVVQSCDSKIFTNIPATRRVKLHFEFKRTKQAKLVDRSAFVNGILQIAQGGSGLVTIGGGTLLGPAIGVTASLLEKNTDSLKNITAGTNAILASFGDTSNPNPVQYPIDPETGTLGYTSGKKAVFTVTKTLKPSFIPTHPALGWPPVAQDFTTTFSALETLYVNAVTAVDTPWSANMVRFCSKLRLQVQSATKGDRVATALAIGYHAFENPTEYKAGATCLNSWEVATLSDMGYAPPFPQAWTAPVAGDPSKTVKVSAKASGRATAMKHPSSRFARGRHDRRRIALSR
ncbi:MAG: hypothetical protein ACTHLO_17670 [Pseudolabrys sp.]